MKVTLNWLKQYVDFDWSPDQLAERLTMLGLEVEGVAKVSGEFEGIVVAQILASDKHPNADKLSVCKVTDGSGERQIVCGAKNYQVGDKVPLILPGSTLPTPPGAQPFVIKVGKLRGVESQGMMCSAKELLISEDAEGLLILPPDAKVGQSLAEHLGRAAGDVVYDLEITPNRPDLNSVIGIAREIAALTGNPLRVPPAELPANPGAPASSLVGVRIDDPLLCPRYTARVIRGVKVAPSPAWLRAALEKVGLRSINNVVDVTNYVMLETGQPLHAFDYHLLATAPGASIPTIVVRRASGGEKFVTLDGKDRVLTPDLLLIADETKAVALAGVMGGRNSEIQDSTVDVLLESACFQARNIRATSKLLDLRTDASYRFERGADPQIAEYASRRATELILQTAGGVAAAGVVDAFPGAAEAKSLRLRHSKVTALLGIEIPPATQTVSLERLGFTVLERDSESIVVRAPSFRVDIKREADLIEEVARLHGVDRIPSTAPRQFLGANAHDTTHDEIAAARQLLVSLGLTEAQGQTLVSDRVASLQGLTEPPPDWIALSNPLSSDMNILRPSLLPGLLAALSHNLHHKTPDVALFEIGRVFRQKDGQPAEQRQLALALTGARQRATWSGEARDAKADFFDLKGLLEDFFEAYGVRGVAFTRNPGHPMFVEAADLFIGKQPLGTAGQLHPATARRHDLRDAVLLCELNLDLLLARRNTARAYKALPTLPAVRRDIAMLVSEATTHEAVLGAIKQAKAPNLETVEVFDVFRGKNVPEGQKSLAYALTYRGSDRTLTDAEVNAAHEKVVTQLKTTLQAVLRE